MAELLANKMLVTQLGSTVNGTFLTAAQTASLLSPSSGGAAAAAPVVADNANMYGSVFTSSARGNIYSTGQWTSSGPNSTYQNATAAGSNATYTHQSFNMFLGDGYPGGTSNNMYSGDFRGLDYRTILYSGNDRLGHNYRELFYYLNNTSYGGVSWHVMPVRNTTGASITRTLNFMFSAYDTYSGAALGYYTPNAATYTATTGGTWTQPFTYTSNTITSSSASIVIPANTTVLVMLVTSHNYQTTYYFKESSMFYGLSAFFGTGLVCDLRMLNALALLRTPSATNTTSYPNQIYTGCATLYGDR
jgi:hypothetical protein